MKKMTVVSSLFLLLALITTSSAQNQIRMAEGVVRLDGSGIQGATPPEVHSKNSDTLSRKYSYNGQIESSGEFIEIDIESICDARSNVNGKLKCTKNGGISETWTFHFQNVLVGSVTHHYVNYGNYDAFIISNRDGSVADNDVYFGLYETFLSQKSPICITDPAFSRIKMLTFFNGFGVSMIVKWEKDSERKTDLIDFSLTYYKTSKDGTRSWISKKAILKRN
jgi:hypothetical protein